MAQLLLLSDPYGGSIRFLLARNTEPPPPSLRSWDVYQSGWSLPGCSCQPPAAVVRGVRGGASPTSGSLSLHRCTSTVSVRWQVCTWPQKERGSQWLQMERQLPCLCCLLDLGLKPQYQPNMAVLGGPETLTHASSRGSSVPMGLAGHPTTTHSAHSAPAR